VIFVMRIGMILTALCLLVNGIISKVRFGSANKFNFEVPLTTLVWLTSFVSSHDLRPLRLAHPLPRR